MINFYELYRRNTDWHQLSILVGAAWLLFVGAFFGTVLDTIFPTIVCTIGGMYLICVFLETIVYTDALVDIAIHFSPAPKKKEVVIYE